MKKFKTMDLQEEAVRLKEANKNNTKEYPSRKIVSISSFDKTRIYDADYKPMVKDVVKKENKDVLPEIQEFVDRTIIQNREFRVLYLFNGRAKIRYVQENRTCESIATARFLNEQINDMFAEMYAEKKLGLVRKFCDIGMTLITYITHEDIIKQANYLTTLSDKLIDWERNLGNESYGYRNV